MSEENSYAGPVQELRISLNQIVRDKLQPALDQIHATCSSGDQGAWLDKRGNPPSFLRTRSSGDTFYPGW
ncbi:MAG: hypothetical protein IPF44_16115 [Betaproteobacteria bacterium]|nr:hypothetical protein [Betaproteobacteria bacterium]MBK7464634.1 hypothetical protein [Betaproteobacteria bacterium]